MTNSKLQQKKLFYQYFFGFSGTFMPALQGILGNGEQDRFPAPSLRHTPWGDAHARRSAAANVYKTLCPVNNLHVSSGA
jgi:hypothetical protein